MKAIQFIILSSLLVLLTACPSKNGGYKNNLKKVQENNMDFPNLRTRYYDGLKYKLSSLFTRNYNDSYTIKGNSDTYEVYDMNVSFSIEKFSAYDAELIAFSFDDVIEPLDAVHDNYLIQRVNSLDNPDYSIKKELPKNSKYKGYYQIIHGDGYYNDESSTYMFATVNCNNAYYVVQLIGKKDNMGYLFDDFLDIIRSIN